MKADRYPWNVRIDVGGVTFMGPGMDSELEAEAIANIVDGDADLQNVEVVRQ
jgi:hypothetical protein